MEKLKQKISFRETTFYDEDNKKIKCNHVDAIESQNDLLELTLWHILK